jgi:hypothetical protein
LKRIFRTAALAALLLASLPAAQAATYSFSGMMDSGSLIGESFFGNFSFDDLGLTGIDFEIRGLSSLSLSFAGKTYTLADADAAPDVSYQDGILLGLSYSASAIDPKIAFVAGFSDTSDAYLAYTKAGIDGAGSVIYAAVPEPKSYAMLLAGLGMLGLLARRRSLRP